MTHQTHQELSRDQKPSISVSDRASPQNHLSVVYIIGTYPLLTTTFIDREIRILRQRGVDIRILAIRRPASETPFSQEQRQLQQGVTYLLPIRWLELILSHLYFAWVRPRCYLRTLIFLLTRSHPSWRHRIKTLLHFGEGVYAAYLVRHHQFKELHAHFADRAATVALVAGRLLDKPYSMSVHAGADIFVDPVLMREKIQEARHVVTCTKFNKAHIESLIGQDLSRQITHIRHGLELDKYCPASSQASKPPLILSVGQLAERKGFAQLIEACRILKDQGYDIHCRIVGRGPDQQRLETLIRQLSLQDTVSLCGALSHDEVIALYREATLFVLPCIKTRTGDVDGIPNVIAEAMAMELPVISTNVSAIPELLTDEVSGLLVPPGDTTALAGAMAKILDSPELRKRLGKNGRLAILESFDLECNIEKFGRTLWPESFNEHFSQPRYA